MTLRTLVMLCAAAVLTAVGIAGSRSEDVRQFDEWETRDWPDYLTFQRCFPISGLLTIVPSESVEAAERLLERDAVLPIDENALRMFFPSGVPNGLKLSETAANMHAAKASDAERSARGKEADTRRWWQFNAAQERYYAQYLRATAPERKAFLVRAVALNKPSGGLAIVYLT